MNVSTIRNESRNFAAGSVARPLPATAAELIGLTSLPHLERTYWRGMTIYSFEDPAAHVYLVLGGRVKLVRASAAGQNKIISIRWRGDVFGEMALTAQGIEMQRRDEAVALDTTRVAVIRTEDFWRSKSNDPAMMQSLLQCLATRLAEAHQQIETLVFENNHCRLARVLLEQYRDAMRCGEKSVRLTHEELAELIGSSREVVTSLMIELRKLGLVDYKRGNVWPHTAALQSFLAENSAA